MILNHNGKKSVFVPDADTFVVVPAKRALSPETETTNDSPNQGLEMKPMRVI